LIEKIPLNPPFSKGEEVCSRTTRELPGKAR
jgi:hypothetical protein